MIAKSGINRSKLKITLISNIMNFLRNFFLLKPTMLCECTSHSHHDFTVSFFNNKKRMNFWNKVIKSLATNLSIINRSFFLRNSGFSLLLIICCVGIFFNPIHQILIGVRNFNVGVIVEEIFSGFCSKKSNKKTPFTINDPCKISQFSISHITPLVEYYAVYNKTKIFVQPERLSSWDISNDICDSLNSTYKKRWRGESEEIFPLANASHKSNRLPVLNSAAARLGQAGRETQDVLQRDNLESTASIVNSVNGTNGDLPTEMAADDVSDVVTLLQNNSGEYITNMIPGQLKIGTSPIGDSYACMSPTQMIPIFNSMDGFTRKFQYPNVSETLSTEWGGINNTRFFVSDQGSITPGASLMGNDVSNNFVVAKEAYKVVWQAGGKMKFIYLPPGYNNDPGMLRHTAAITFYQGQCVTQDLWIVNLRSTLFRA